VVKSASELYSPVATSEIAGLGCFLGAIGAVAEGGKNMRFSMAVARG